MSNWINVNPPTLASGDANLVFASAFPTTVEPANLPTFVYPPNPANPTVQVTDQNQSLLASSLQKEGSCQNSLDLIRTKLLPYLKNLPLFMSVQNKLLNTVAKQSVVLNQDILETHNNLVTTAKTQGATNQLIVHSNYITAESLSQWQAAINEKYLNLTQNINQTNTTISSNLGETIFPPNALGYDQVIANVGPWRQKSFIPKH